MGPWFVMACSSWPGTRVLAQSCCSRVVAEKDCNQEAPRSGCCGWNRGCNCNPQLFRLDIIVVWLLQQFGPARCGDAWRLSMFLRYLGAEGVHTSQGVLISDIHIATTLQVVLCHGSVLVFLVGDSHRHRGSIEVAKSENEVKMGYCRSKIDSRRASGVKFVANLFADLSAETWYLTVFSCVERKQKVGFVKVRFRECTFVPDQNFRMVGSRNIKNHGPLLPGSIAGNDFFEGISVQGNICQNHPELETTLSCEPHGRMLNVGNRAWFLRSVFESFLFAYVCSRKSMSLKSLNQHLIGQSRHRYSQTVWAKPACWSTRSPHGWCHNQSRETLCTSKQEFRRPMSTLDAQIHIHEYTWCTNSHSNNAYCREDILVKTRRGTNLSTNWVVWVANRAGCVKPCGENHQRTKGCGSGLTKHSQPSPMC